MRCLRTSAIVSSDAICDGGDDDVTMVYSMIGLVEDIQSSLVNFEFMKGTHNIPGICVSCSRLVHLHLHRYIR